MIYKGRTKKFRDTIHGCIDIPDIIVLNIIDAQQFQRLRYIEQTSMRSLYPATRHDRFIHSLGVYWLGQQAFQYFRLNSQNELSEEEKNVLTDKWWNNIAGKRSYGLEKDSKIGNMSNGAYSAKCGGKGDLNILERTHVPHYSTFYEWEYHFCDAFLEAGYVDVFRQKHSDARGAPSDLQSSAVDGVQRTTDISSPEALAAIPDSD